MANVADANDVQAVVNLRHYGHYEATAIPGVGTSFFHDSVTNDGVYTVEIPSIRRGDKVLLPLRTRVASDIAQLALSYLSVRVNCPLNRGTALFLLAMPVAERFWLFSFDPPAALRYLAEFSWHTAPSGDFALDVGNERLLVTRTLLDEWKLLLLKPGVREELHTGPNLEGMIAFADRWVETERTDRLALVSEYAEWRGLDPAAKQLDLLGRMRAPAPQAATRAPSYGLNNKSPVEGDVGASMSSATFLSAIRDSPVRFSSNA